MNGEGAFGSAKEGAKRLIKRLTNVHRPDGSPDVFLFALPRGGSTWLMELIWSQPGFKPCWEPLNVRDPRIREALGIDPADPDYWCRLYDRSSEEAMERYFRGYCSGREHLKDISPFRRKYQRILTRRIVFKILHGGEDRINWLRDRFGGRVVLLLRHPIPVSLSREVYPRLDAFVRSDYRRHFTESQLRLAERIISSGSRLERGTLSWCFQVSVPLRQAEEDWAIVTYEQLVLDPEPVIRHLARKLELPEPERMLAVLSTPSSTTFKSAPSTRKLLESGAREAARTALVSRWREEVSADEEERVFAILRAFGVEAYGPGSPVPDGRYWISDVEAFPNALTLSPAERKADQ